MLSRIYHLIKKISCFFFFGKLSIRTEYFRPFVEDFGERFYRNNSNIGTRCCNNIFSIYTELCRINNCIMLYSLNTRSCF